MKRLLLLTLVGVGIIVGGIIFVKKMTIISLKNVDHSGTIYVFPLKASEQFSIFYIHSLYNAPVIEEFRVEQENIILKGVRTKSPAVIEYYGFEDMKEFHLMEVRLGPVLTLRRGTGEEQGVEVGEKTFYFKEMAEIGDRIELSIKSASWAKYLLASVIKIVPKSCNLVFWAL